MPMDDGGGNILHWNFLDQIVTDFYQKHQFHFH
jgi:hypothetical protein